MYDHDADLQAIDAELAWLARSRGRLRLRLGQVLDAMVTSGGHRELGFNSARDYALERLSRSGGWAAESRTVARRVAELPHVRRAFDEGRLGWSKLELLCRHATVETERALVEVACSASVRALRAALAEPRVEDETDDERVTLTRRMPIEHAVLFEATLAVVEHTSADRAPSTSIRCWARRCRRSSSTRRPRGSTSRRRSSITPKRRGRA